MKELKFSEEIRIKGLGAFPSMHYPKIIYTKVSGNIKPIFHKLNSFLKIENRKEFIPHVTICRAKKLIGKIDESEFESKEFTFTADSLHLFNSDFTNYYKIL